MKNIFTLFLFSILSFSSLAQVRIINVDPTTEQFTLKNFGTTTVDVSNWWTCQLSVYDELTTLDVLSGNLVLTAGSSVTIGGGAFVINDAFSDFAIYNSTNYSLTTAMEDFTQWGTGGNGREPVAVAKGIWTANTFITGDAPYFYIGNGTQNFVTAWRASVVNPAACDDLFFSEYIEGSSNNKALEIYNPTSSAISLTGYVVKTYNNGSLTANSTLNLSGMLNAGDVYVISHTTANAAILAVKDTNVTGGVVSFNGDDVVELYNGTTLIDAIGTVGQQPIEFAVSTGGGTLNNTLVRKPWIHNGYTVWGASSDTTWLTYPQDDFNYIGSHSHTSCNAGPLVASFTSSGFCSNDPFIFTNTTSGGTTPYTYVWDFGDATPTSTLTNPTHTYAAGGTYTVTLTATDGVSAIDSYSEVITVNQSPTTSFSASVLTGCAPLLVTFTDASTVITTPATYDYDFDDGNTAFTPNASNTFTNAGTYNVNHTVTDANGCSDTDSITIVVTAADDASFSYAQSTYCITDGNPTPSITGLVGGTFSSGTATINSSTGEINILISGTGAHVITYTTNGTCPNSQNFTVNFTSSFSATITPAGPFCTSDAAVNLTVSPTGGTWSGTGITNATTGTFDPAVAGAGTFAIVFDPASSCGDDDTVMINVNTNADATIITEDTVLCNDSFGMFMQAQNTGGVWSGTNVSDQGNGQGFFSSGAITPGNYTAYYTISGTCGDVDSMLITVADYPTADFSVSIVGANISFTDASTGTGINSWLWYFIDCGDTTTSTLQNPTFVTQQIVDCPVSACLSVSSAPGCSNMLCEVVVAGNVNENEFFPISVYPNPVSDQLNIELPSVEDVSLQITDAAGRLIYSNHYSATNKLNIPFQQIATGAYTLRVISSKGIAQKLFIKN